ncbi:MAG TPA: zinc metalloprotease HtpX [Candidatus Acidoferrum sp.]|jgi:heat shock protein HtpX|nr:zinc metalloprotease HtpX [Candidatus Acidoferrum sp.]
MRILRSAFLLGVLTLVLMMVGQYFGGRNGMTLGLGIAIVANAFAYFFSDKIALASSRAQPVSREQWPRLYDVMERLAAKANIPVPRLYIIPEAAPNAFATGRNPRHASVAVTKGLLELMNDEELEGVIAHELSHVRNYDILISSIAATLAGAITWIAHWGPWLGMGDGDDDRDRGGSWVFALLLMILAPLGALLLQLGLSRQREYSADETGAQMVGNPYGLIQALQKLGAYNSRIPTTAISPSTSALCIVRPLLGRGSGSSLFSTHPPLEDRIAALRAMTIVPRR